MSRHATSMQQAAAWAEGIEDVWGTWSDPLRSAERLLAAPDAHDLLDEDDFIELLRRAQYGAHAASELLAGLEPPHRATHAHELLVGTLATCRDTLGVVAVRAETGELDGEACRIAHDAVRATRRSFEGALETSRAAARVAQGTISALDPAEDLRASLAERDGDRYDEPHASRGMLVLLWGMVATCGVLFTALVAQLLLDGRLG